MTHIKRTYKDSLFRELFGSEERKAYALELYNALAGTDHDDPAQLELTTIGNAIYSGYRNDVSFLIGNETVLLEHQSTRNPNMPFRGLQYLTRLYTKLVESSNFLDVYGERPMRLPTPRYYVLYFGRAEQPDCEVLRLSDLFANGPGDLELTATVLNCNEGRNAAIMDASEALSGYAHLVALAREHAGAGMGLEESVSRAVDRCIDEGVLADYLEPHRAEAIDMLFTEEDEPRAMRVHWEAVAREAREAGLEQGMLASLRGVMATTGCDAASAMDMLQIPAGDREKLQLALSA